MSNQLTGSEKYIQWLWPWLVLFQMPKGRNIEFGADGI